MDQRDSILNKLSSMMNIQTVNQPDGSVNVYVGSEPLVIAGNSSGVAVQTKTVNDEQVSTVVFASDNDPMALTSGQLGAMQSMQSSVGRRQLRRWTAWPAI